MALMQEIKVILVIYILHGCLQLLEVIVNIHVKLNIFMLLLNINKLKNQHIVRLFAHCVALFGNKNINVNHYIVQSSTVNRLVLVTGHSKVLAYCWFTLLYTMSFFFLPEFLCKGSPYYFSNFRRVLFWKTILHF